MLITASTVLDAPENVRRFVADNLAGGVDHLVIFLDAPAAPEQDVVAAELDEHPHVTCVRADDAWWRGNRPAGLNKRQRIHANLTIALAEAVPEVEWVVHLDGDEVASVDRQVLDALPPTTESIWLQPLEAVSRFEAEDRPVLFKRLLERDELSLLTILGLVAAPTNQEYFHGHVRGKSGVRPRSGLRLLLHDAVTPHGHPLPKGRPPAVPGMDLLHYDAISGEQFVRKWRAMSAAGSIGLRPGRRVMAEALTAVLRQELPPDVVDAYLRRIYEATTQDDVATLHELGLLRQVDPREGRHRPGMFSQAGRRQWDQRLEQLRTQNKQPFHLNHAKPGDGGRKRGTKTGRRRSSGPSGASA